MTKTKNRIAAFHANEKGTGAIESVVILCVGCIVLYAVLSLWQDKITPGTEGLINKVLDFVTQK